MADKIMNMPAEKYFYSEHRPALGDGKYEIEISQGIDVDDKNVYSDKFSFSFEVAGEQYSLNPRLVNAVFPPANGVGEYSDVLPNLILERSTLPWERSGNGQTDGAPWLALLLYAESEAGNYSVSQVPMDQIDSTSKSKDLISIISTTDPAQFTEKLPSAQELSCLIHVREEAGKETSVIICNRLPAKGEKNTVHLVSVENCYDPAGSFKNKLVSLYSWSFFCTEHFKFTGDVLNNLQKNNILDKQLMDSLNDNYRDQEFFSWNEFIKTVSDKTLLTKLQENKDMLLEHFDLGHLSGILKHLDRNVLRGISTFNPAISEAGYSTVPYINKEGKQVDAIYRGPLVPFSEPVNVTAPFKVVQNADQHFRTCVLEDKKLPEISHASAWELGRLLCLQNKKVSQSLFEWKRKYYQVRKNIANSGNYNHLPINRDNTIPPLPLVVKDYMDDLATLKGIPFNYLIAAEQMLPFESIRFFCVDMQWLKYLMDGVLSVGRLLSSDIAADETIWSDHLGWLFQKKCSGFLLRSVAVAGWPGLFIEADVQIKRREVLSRDVLLCVFDGIATKITMHEKPEMRHFVGDVKNSNGWISYRNETDRTISIPFKEHRSSELASALISKPKKIVFEC